MGMSAGEKAWKCKCGFLLGITSPTGKTLRIKYKDLYLTISGDDVTVTEICRRCAAANTTRSTPNLPTTIKEAIENKPKTTQ